MSDPTKRVKFSQFKVMYMPRATEPGEPRNPPASPELLEQIKEMEERRAKVARKRYPGEEGYETKRQREDRMLRKFAEKDEENRRWRRLSHNPIPPLRSPLPTQRTEFAQGVDYFHAPPASGMPWPLHRVPMAQKYREIEEERRVEEAQASVRRYHREVEERRRQEEAAAKRQKESQKESKNHGRGKLE